MAAAAVDTGMAIEAIKSPPPTVEDALSRMTELKAVCKRMLAANAAPSGTTSEGEAWRLEKEIEGLVIHSASVPGLSARRFRATTRLPCSPKFFRDSCVSFDERLKWDTAVAETSQLHGEDKCGEGSTIWRLIVNGAFGVSRRDFVEVGTIEIDDDRTLWSYGQSVAADDVPSGDCVRGVNYPGSGWVVRPAEGPDGSKACDCSYVVLTDLKGWLLSSVVSMALTGQFTQFFKQARAHIESRLAGGAEDDG